MARPSGDQAMGAETSLSSRTVFPEAKSRIMRDRVDERVAMRGNGKADEDDAKAEAEGLPTRRGDECSEGEKLATGPMILE